MRPNSYLSWPQTGTSAASDNGQKLMPVLAAGVVTVAAVVIAVVSAIGTVEVVSVATFIPVARLISAGITVAIRTRAIVTRPARIAAIDGRIPVAGTPDPASTR